MATQHCSAPSSGAIHVRTRLSEQFTILANRLAQRPGSAATVGVALFINSMPDGTAITIEALRKHFTEGETVIGRALRELEADGWLERRIVRCRDGRFATRTYVYTLPELAHPADTQEQATPPPPQPAPSCVGRATRLPSPHTKQPEPARAASTAPHTEPFTPAAPFVPAEPAVRAVPCTPAAPITQPEPSTDPPAQPHPAPTTPAAETETTHPLEPARPAAPASPEAVALLTELGTQDPRLTLSHREIDRLAPGVDTWLTSGVQPPRITSTLTTDLPTTFRTRPAAVLAWRLAELRPAPTPEPPPTFRPAPMQNCEDCDRGFRSTTPGRCPYCEHARRHPTPPPSADGASDARRP